MSNVHHKAVLANNAALLKSGDYSDMTIVCDGREFHVHKAIVCSASPVIAACFKHDTQERKTGVLEQKEFDADTVQRMIEYIYTGKYSVFQVEEETESGIANKNGGANPSGKRKRSDSEGSLPKPRFTTKDTNDFYLAHAKVYAIGEYYDIFGLWKMASERFATVLVDTGLEFNAEGFIAVVSKVYDTVEMFSDDPLWRALLDLTRIHHEELFASDDYIEALSNDPGFQRYAYCTLEDFQTQYGYLFNDLAYETREHEQDRRDSVKSMKQREKIIDAKDKTIAALEETIESLKRHLTLLNVDCSQW